MRVAIERERVQIVSADRYKAGDAPAAPSSNSEADLIHIKRSEPGTSCTLREGITVGVSSSSDISKRVQSVSTTHSMLFICNS